MFHPETVSRCTVESDNRNFVKLSVGLVFVGALCLRFAAIGYGLPMEFDADERIFSDSALRMVVLRTLDPHWYGAPASTLMILLATCYQLYYFIGDFSSYQDLLHQYFSDITPFFLIGRAVSAAFGAACAAISILICREMSISVFWSTIAGILVAVSPTMVAYSSIIRMDMLQIFFILLFIYYALKATRDPTLGKFAAIGVFLGLATTSKYPSIVLIATGLWVLYFLRTEKGVPMNRIILFFRISAIGALIAVFVSGPYIFINFGTTLENLRHEARPDLTHNGLFDHLLGYITSAMPPSLSYLVTYMGLTGLLFSMFWNKNKIISISFFSYIFFISVLPLYWVRWILPLIPLCAIAATCLCEEGERFIWKLWRDKKAFPEAFRTCFGFARIILALAIIAPVGWSGYIEAHSRFRNADTRALAADWIRENVPEGSTVMLESFTPALPVQNYNVIVAKAGRLVRWQEISNSARPTGYFGTFATELAGIKRCRLFGQMRHLKVRYILLAHWQAKFERLGDEYKKERSVYRSIDAVSTLVEAFDARNVNGPHNEIRQVEKGLLSESCAGSDAAE